MTATSPEEKAEGVLILATCDGLPQRPHPKPQDHWDDLEAEGIESGRWSLRVDQAIELPVLLP